MFRHFGHYAVVTFFILSGFLITYLLAQELGHNGKINLKRFYTHRFKRIVPLYFAVFLIAFVLFPAIAPIFPFHPYYAQFIPAFDADWPVKSLLYLAFLQHTASIVLSPILAANQAWSLQYEWYFYMLYPLVLSKVGLKRIQPVLLLGLALFTLYLAGHYYHLFQTSGLIRKIPFYPLFLGSLAGVVGYTLKNRVVVQKTKLFPFLTSRPAILFLVGCWILFFLLPAIPGWLDFLFMAMSAFLIANFALHKKLNNALEGPTLKWLGRISYSVYMLHPAIIFLTFSLFSHWLPATWTASVALCTALTYFTVIPLTLFLAHLSYRSIETPLRRSSWRGFLFAFGKKNPLPQSSQFISSSSAQ